MEFSITSRNAAQRGEVVNEAQREASRQILGQLDDQDFQVLKVLEDKGDLDAFEVAGVARLRPAGVIETLAKLDGLGLVRVADESFPSQHERRFVIDDEQLATLSE